MLIWPEEPQLVDLVSFAEMGRHDPVPFFDLTSKQSDVGHHSSVVVKAGVKHQGLKRVIRACYRPENPKTKKVVGRREIIRSTSVCVKSLHFSKKWKWRFLRGDSVNNCLKNLSNICSKFGWYLKEIQASTWKKVGQGKRTSYKNYNSLECTPHVEYQTPFQSATPLFLDQHFLDQSMGDRPI